MRNIVRSKRVAEQNEACDARKMQIESRKTTGTPAWKAVSGKVFALRVNVKSLLEDLVSVVDICNQSQTHRLEYSQTGTPANASATC